MGSAVPAWASNIGTTPGSSAGAASGAFNALSDVIGGFSKQGEADAQAQIARNNAIIARRNADLAAATGEARAEQQGLKTRGQVADIKARQAGAGLDVNTGSAVDVRQSASQLGMLDALNIKANAARLAYGYQLEAGQQELQSKLYRKAGKIAPWEGAFNAAGSLLGSASSLSNQYKIWQQTAGSAGGGHDIGAQAGTTQYQQAQGDYDALFTE